ncbi:MAG TPA: response regulator [Caulobacteraceae bacterium]|jgi:CheY-like chemotaxis protein
MSEPPKGRVNLEKAAVLLLSPQTGMEMLVRIFHGFGVRHPYRAYSGQRAMEVCGETPLDLIICDGSLPNGETYDFIAALRRSDLEPTRYTPVMVIQGHTPADQILKARDCGANFVVAKPITPRLLLERVLWIAGEQRPFIELDTYVGPDRRFQNLGPPGELEAGRRRADRAAAAPRPDIDPKDSLL